MIGLGIFVSWASGASEASQLASAFTTRVVADGGTVESKACLTTDLTYLTNNPNAPTGYSVDFSSATVGSSADFIISGANIIGYSYTYAVTDSQATEVTGTGVIDSNADTITADLSTLVDGTVTVAVYLSGAGGDGLVVTDTATLSGIDADYQAVLDYATTQGYTAPSASQQTLQNTLVTDLKTAGVWSKLDVFYMFATDGDSDFATLNWKAPSSHQVTKVNSPTFTSNEGYNGDGSSSYLDTNLSVANATNYTRDNASFGFYFYQFASTGYDFGLNSGSILRYRSRAATRHRLNSLTSLSKTFGTSNGFQGMTRPNSTAARFIEPSGIISSDLASNSSFIPPTANFTIFSYDNAHFSNSKISMFFVGGNLESSNAADFHDAIDTYISAL